MPSIAADTSTIPTTASSQENNMKRFLTALFALSISALGAAAQTGQSDTTDRSDSGSLSAGQKESMPATQGEGENLRGEPAEGAASDAERGDSATGASSGETGSAAGDDAAPTMKKPTTSDPSRTRQ